MATEWFTGRKLAGILVGSAALGGLGYLVYRNLKETETDDKDEGFVDTSKADDVRVKRILLLGLDGSGKTSIMKLFSREGISAPPKPTEGFHVIDVNTEKAAFNIWEIGGAETFRKWWINFIVDTKVLVYVVDSADEARLPEANIALHDLLGDARLTHVPIIVLANKQDLPSALNASSVQHALGLDNLSTKDRHVYAIGTQAPLSGIQMGIEEFRALLNRVGGSV